MRQPGHLPSSFTIDHAKLWAYLLNVEHPTGKAKAAFFIGQGFSTDRIDELADALSNHALLSPWTEEPTMFGINLVFRGPLTTPSGKAPNVVSVWHEPQNADGSVRFVTAYPD